MIFLAALKIYIMGERVQANLIWDLLLINTTEHYRLRKGEKRENKFIVLLSGS